MPRLSRLSRLPLLSRLSRLPPLLVVLVLLGGCSAQADPSAPALGPVSSPSERVAPYHLDRLDALGAVRALRPRGFTRALTCATRRPEPCRRPGTKRAGWFVASLDRGAALPRGHGPGEFVTTAVTAWPSVARAASYAARLTEQLERYDGEYALPAERGRGELHQVSFSGWRGAVLRRVFHYVFDDLSPSASVPGGHAVLRQGRFVVDLEWVARDQQTDRRLTQLPRRLLRTLR